MKNPFLIGALIYLRPLERADAPQLVEWINDPEVTRTLKQYRPIDLQSEEEYLDRARQAENQLALGIVARDADHFVGVTGFHHIDTKNRHASFGILIGDKASWGKGYGTEATRLLVGHAFETLNLNRVWLHVYEDNERGRRVYEKVGFRREGVLRQDNYRAGRYRDTIVMGVLREEWRPAEA